MTILDILFLIFLVIFFIRGYSRGFILAIVKLFSYLLGVVVALNFSTWLSAKLFENGDSMLAKIFPLFSYVILFIATVILVNFIGKKIQKAFSIPVVGTLNKLMGGIVYALIFTFVASTFIYLSAKVGIINEESQTESKTFAYIEPVAPIVFANIGYVLPFSKDTFDKLNGFFANLSNKVS